MNSDHVTCFGPDRIRAAVGTGDVLDPVRFRRAHRVAVDPASALDLLPE